MLDVQRMVEFRRHNTGNLRHPEFNLLGVRGYGKAGGKAAGKATKSDATVTSSSISVDLSGLIGLQTVGLVLFHTAYCTHSLPAVVLGVSIFRGNLSTVLAMLLLVIASHTFYIFSAI